MTAPFSISDPKLPVIRRITPGPKQEIARFGDTRMSMEDRYLARMLLAQRPPKKKEPARRTFTPAEHREIRRQIIQLCKGRWMKCVDVAEQLEVPKATAGSKLSDLVSQGFMLAKGPKAHRFYKTNPDAPKDKRRQRLLDIEARVELVAALIAERPAITRTGIMEATDLTRAQVECALETLFKTLRIHREKHQNRVYRYYPGEGRADG